MGTADVRDGRIPHAPWAAGASVFVPIALVAWVSWQTIEGDRDTLLRSQFSTWLLVIACAAALTCLAAGVFWRTTGTRAGVILGALAAVLAVMGGLLVDIAGSGGLA